MNIKDQVIHEIAEYLNRDRLATKAERKYEEALLRTVDAIWLATLELAADKARASANERAAQAAAHFNIGVKTFLSMASDDDVRRIETASIGYKINNPKCEVIEAVETLRACRLDYDDSLKYAKIITDRVKGLTMDLSGANQVIARLERRVAELKGVK